MTVVNNAVNVPALANAIVIGNSSGVEFTSIAAVATGTVLISNGTGSAPSYSASPTLTGTLTLSNTGTALTTSGNIIAAGGASTVQSPKFSSTGNIGIQTGASGFIQLYCSSGNPVALRYYSSNQSNYVSLAAPSGMASNIALTLPAALAGSTNAPLVSSTAGVLSFGTSIGLGKASTTTGSIVIYNSSNANTLTFQSGATSTSGGVVWTLPRTDGTAGQALTTNGSGVLGWTTFLL